MENKTFNPVKLKKTIRAIFYPATAKKPARFRVSIENFKTRFMSIHEMEDIDFPYYAQALVEKRIDELGLCWNIAAAGLIKNGDYIFIIE